MSQELMDRVIAVIVKTQHLDASRVTPDAAFEELGIDSLDGVNILFGLENEFDIQISDEQAKQIRTVRQAAEGVEKLVSTKVASSG